MRTLRPSGRRSLSFLVSGTVFAQGIQFAASLFLARLYTPDEFGQYASILAIASVFGAVITFSYPTAIPLAEDDEESRVLAWLSSAGPPRFGGTGHRGPGGRSCHWRRSIGVAAHWQHVVFVPLTSLAIAVWGTLQFRQSRLSAFHRVALATSSGAATQAGTQLVWDGPGQARRASVPATWWAGS